MASAGGEVRTDLTNGVLVVTVDHPPANALTPGLRGAILHALDEAVAARAVAARAVVICGAGRSFSAAVSVDVAEGAPSLADLCDRVETLGKPVVVVLTGLAMGPGAELALAAHARVAEQDARLVLPEVGLGLCPGGGATQRLPRLVGAAEALDMLLKARPVGAVEGLAMGLIDQVVEGDALAAGIAYAAGMAAPRPVCDRRDGMRDPVAYQAAVDAARADAARGTLPAPSRIVDCVEAALYLPFENGMAMEAVAHEDLAASAEAAGLRSAALAERRAAALPAAVGRATPVTVTHLGLVGGAAQMAPLALVALTRGLKVTWADADGMRLQAALKWIAARQEAELRAGRMTAVQRDADWARLVPAQDAIAVKAAGLVVQAEAGAGVAALGRQMPGVPQLVLGGAEGALGLGLPPSARISELALPEGPSPEQVARVVQTLRRLGLPPVLVGKMPVLGRRVAGAGRAALARLLAMGVPRRVLAAGLDGFGQPMPDLPDPETPAPMRAMDEDEVLRRWLAAMANEGLRLLDGRVARRPSDVDHLLVSGFGFPRWRGGPMHQAGQRGLMVLRRDMRVWARDDALWQPHPLMDRLIADGMRLSDLDGPA